MDTQTATRPLPFSLRLVQQLWKPVCVRILFCLACLMLLTGVGFGLILVAMQAYAVEIDNDCLMIDLGGGYYVCAAYLEILAWAGLGLPLAAVFAWLVQVLWRRLRWVGQVNVPDEVLLSLAKGEPWSHEWKWTIANELRRQDLVLADVLRLHRAHTKLIKARRRDELRQSAILTLSPKSGRFWSHNYYKEPVFKEEKSILAFFQTTRKLAGLAHARLIMHWNSFGWSLEGRYAANASWQQTLTVGCRNGKRQRRNKPPSNNKP